MSKWGQGWALGCHRRFHPVECWLVWSSAPSGGSPEHFERSGVYGISSCLSHGAAVERWSERGGEIEWEMGREIEGERESLGLTSIQVGWVNYWLWRIGNIYTIKVVDINEYKIVWKCHQHTPVSRLWATPTIAEVCSHPWGLRRDFQLSGQPANNWGPVFIITVYIYIIMAKGQIKGKYLIQLQVQVCIPSPLKRFLLFLFRLSVLTWSQSYSCASSFPLLNARYAHTRSYIWVSQCLTFHNLHIPRCKHRHTLIHITPVARVHFAALTITPTIHTHTHTHTSEFTAATIH